MEPRPIDRGRHPGRERSRVLSLCFNGATANRPWKTWSFSAVSRRDWITGFNGATANRPWKTRAKTRASGAPMYCFNGATANRPWKTCRSISRVLACSFQLQWSHGQSTVEDSYHRGGESGLGPLQLSHGQSTVGDCLGPLYPP